MKLSFPTTLLFAGIAAVAAFAAPSAQAQNLSSPAPANLEQSNQQTAVNFIQDLGNKAISIIADKTVGDDRRRQKYDQLLRDAFDLKTIGHFVIGRAWDSATPEQRQQYMDLFEKMVVKIYGDRLNFYSGEQFRVTGARKESDEDTVVNSHITHPDGSRPTEIDWRVRYKNNRYVVIDVVVEGVSQSVTQRQEYSSVIERDGGKIDGLLDLMRQQVQGTAPAVAPVPSG